MKRVKLAAALIALILLVGTFSVGYTYTTTQAMTAMLEEIRTKAAEDSTEQTVMLCRAYNAEWSKRERVLTRLLRHHPIDTVSELSAQLETFAAHGERVMLLSTVDQLEESMRHIWEEECPSPLNVL